MSIRLAHNEDDADEVHEINVTPFIDVILVLLIIFMVAAPLTTVNVPVDLPASTAAPTPPPAEPIYVTLKDDFSLALGDRVVAREDFTGALDRASKGEKETRIMVRADRHVDYDHLMGLMNILRDAGYLKVALVGVEAGAAPIPNG